MFINFENTYIIYRNIGNEHYEKKTIYNTNNYSINHKNWQKRFPKYIPCGSEALFLVLLELSQD